MIGKTICSGQQQAWNLIDKVGEGDAGEVYTVESVIDRKVAILKRPRAAAFPSDIIRQANQIEKEGRILSFLSRLNRSDRIVVVPPLLDQSIPGSEYSERFFIVIDKARGFNLTLLANSIRTGAPGPAEQNDRVSDSSTLALPSEFSAVERHYLEELGDKGKIPHFILARMIVGLIEFLEEIHQLEFNMPSAKQYGVLWNDVKPEHLFWDVREVHLTVVDWGNGQFLQANGTTTDGTLSRLTDHYQLVTEMGNFLEHFAPDFYVQIDWPTSITASNAYSAGILPLKKRLSDVLRRETNSINKVRQEEAKILKSPRPNDEKYFKLAKIHGRLLESGEIPDYSGAEEYLQSVASSLIQKRELEKFKKLCLQVSNHPILDEEKYLLLARIAEITITHTAPIDALKYGLQGDWISCLWELRLLTLSGPDPSWWDELSKTVRRFELGSDVLSPFVALNRLIHTLHADILSNELSHEPPASKHHARQKMDLPGLYQVLKDEIIPRWTNPEPDPPDSGLEYREIEKVSETISNSIPQAGETLLKSLYQPQAQVKITMDAWEHKDFDTARLGLRRILFWDPDRLRVITADNALEAAQTWLEEVRGGLKKDEPLQDFITRIELAGRELRNQVGSATWLDSLLDAFKQLRKGNEPTDVLMEHPDIRDEIGWLITLEPRRPLLATPGQLVLLERKIIPKYQRPTVFGMKESSMSAKAGFALDNALDTWVPEARGSSARVFSGNLSGHAGETHAVAVKIMRHNRSEYALPLFREETRILTLLQDIPGVNPLLECGFIQLDGKQQLPPEEKDTSIQDLTGSVQRFGLDSVHNFLTDLENKVETGWLPYLAIEKQEKGDNLLLLCDTGYTRGRFLPILEGLRMGIQICDILEAAHTRNITFRDHKILHYYWQEVYNGTFVIDWNIARRYPEGVPDEERQFDLVQFGARTLHYILTGRPAPGALPMGPNRPEEIDAAARSYLAHWTYDDQRLPGDIKELLESLLAGNYTDARNLREDLYSIFSSLSELI